MTRLFLILPLLLLFASQCPATTQAPDYLIYRGNEFMLTSYPLEQLFEQHDNLRPVSEVVASDNYRGYIATYTITDDQLFIKDIITIKADSTREFGYREHSALSEVFPEAEDCKLTWYSGLLVVPQYDPGSGNTSALTAPNRFILFSIQSGELTSINHMTPDQFLQFRRERFQHYRNSDAYKQRLLELGRWLPGGTDEDFAELIFEEGAFIHSTFTEHSPPPTLGQKTQTPKPGSS